jgi:hypothetical protein
MRLSNSFNLVWALATTAVPIGAIVLTSGRIRVGGFVSHRRTDLALSTGNRKNEGCGNTRKGSVGVRWHPCQGVFRFSPFEPFMPLFAVILPYFAVFCSKSYALTVKPMP